MPKEEIQVITATAESAGEATKIGSEEFLKQLFAELNSKNTWRKLESLAEALHVDVVQLREWLDKSSDFMRKPGKSDGVFYYCSQAKFISEVIEANNKKEKHRLQRPVVRDVDRFAHAILHMVYWNFHSALKTYALEISQRDKEAWNNLANSLDKLEAGLVLFSRKTGIEIEKLPKFS